MSRSSLSHPVWLLLAATAIIVYYLHPLGISILVDPPLLADDAISPILASVDGYTHQLFGEAYAYALRTHGLSALLSNQFVSLGYGAVFPDQYPPLFHILSALGMYVFKCSWWSVALTLVALSYFYLLCELYGWLTIVFGSYRSRPSAYWFVLMLSFGFMLGHQSFGEKGVAVFSVLFVGLYSQLLASALLSTYFRLQIADGARSWIRHGASVAVLGLAFYTNIVSYPLFLLGLVAMVAAKGQLKCGLNSVVHLLLSLILAMPWLVPFLWRSPWSPTRNLLIGTKHLLEPIFYMLAGVFLLASCWSGTVISWQGPARRLLAIVLAVLVVVLLWSLVAVSAPDLRLVAVLASLPVQWARYFPYITWMLIFLSAYHFSVLPLSGRSRVRIISSLAAVNILIYSPIPSSLFVSREAQWVARDAMASIPMDGVSRKRWLAPSGHYDLHQHTDLVRAFNYHALKSGYDLASQGYWENSPLVQLLAPVHYALNGEPDLGLHVYQPLHVSLLSQQSLATHFIHLLQHFAIDVVLCWRDYPRGVCADPHFLEQTKVLVSSVDFTIRRIPTPTVSVADSRLKAFLYVGPQQTKYRVSFEPISSYQNLFETIAFADRTIASTFLILDRPLQLQDQECLRRHLEHQFDQVHILSVRDHWLAWPKNYIRQGDVSGLINHMPIQPDFPSRSPVEPLTGYRPGQQPSDQLQLIRFPYFTYQIDCATLTGTFR